LKCAVIGSTGWMGVGVATRIASAGHTAVMGSRDIERSQKLIKKLPLLVELPPERFQATTNLDALDGAEYVFITVPMPAHKETLELIKDRVQDKIIVDVTAPVDPENLIENLWPDEGSATQQAQAILGEDVAVVGALKNIAAVVLMNHKKDSNCDILVTGEDIAAKFKVISLLREMGLNSYDVGSDDMCRTVEGLTSLLILLNYSYHLNQPGVKVVPIATGMDYFPDESLLE
jgi:NADPH-dependent F420 reductase